MQQAVAARTPAHVWIVGILSLLWGCFGAYDYTMTRMRSTEYIKSSMPGVDPNAALAWIDSMPMYAQVGWGLGVWFGLLGSIGFRSFALMPVERAAVARPSFRCPACFS